MKPLVLTLLFTLMALPATAAIAPIYHEQARANAPDVVVVVILASTPPAGPLGDCQVRSRVTSVERGSRYSVGQIIMIPVGCHQPRAQIPAGGREYYVVGALRPGLRARAFLTAEGRPAMDAFDLLP